MTLEAPTVPILARRVASLVSPSAFGAVLGDPVGPDAIALTGGSPAVEALPRQALIDATAAVLSDPSRTARALDYSAHQGHAGLREWIARHEGTRADRVVITNGALHALSLTFLATIDPGDTVLVEDPVYPLVAKVLQLSEARVESIPVDANGLNVDVLEARLRAGLRPRAIYVVPDFHNPTGRTLPAERRIRLVELAEQYGFLVVSDNPYTELRGTGERLADLSLESSHVVHVNTFSKTLGPGLRLGWAVLPAGIVPGVLDLRSRLDQHASSLLQETVAEFVSTDGAFQTLVTDAASLYRQRALALKGALDRELAGVIETALPDGGVFAWPRLVDTSIEVSALASAARAHGVLIIPGEQFAVDPGSTDAARHFRASFGQQAPDRLDEAARRLATAYASLERVCR